MGQFADLRTGLKRDVVIRPAANARRLPGTQVNADLGAPRRGEGVVVRGIPSASHRSASVQQVPPERSVLWRLGGIVFRRSAVLAVLVASSAVLLSLPVALASAPGTPNTAATVEAAARQRAEQDVSSDRPALTVAELNLLFARDLKSTNVTLGGIDNAYRQTYDSAAKRLWWKKLSPAPGWALSILLFLLLIFRDSIKDGLKKVLDAVGGSFYSRFAGSRLLRRRAIERYRKALRTRLAELKVPFRPDHELDLTEAYVPLLVRGGESHAALETSAGPFEHATRVVIIGPPGAGKSMLLKHEALIRCSGNKKYSGDIPVYLEAGRLADGGLSVCDTLVDAFRANDFPNAGPVLDQAIARGSLVLLIDGLDEIGESARSTTAARIQDFLLEHPQLRFAVTCRDGVYANEFYESAAQVLRVVEFTDQQIRDFLAPWRRQMPAGKSLEQLTAVLDNQPRLKMIARNPLMLTILAFLYVDSEFSLPHSRAAFYSQALDVLLRQWKGERNRFKASHKRLVLEHLGLFANLSREGVNGARAIELTDALREVSDVLPRLNLDMSEAAGLLEEIVERSGLLLALDGGLRFQFAHLTLQEYLAATELRSQPVYLVEQLEAEPDSWREVARLWCSLGHDATSMIAAIRRVDPLIAFECLADAQDVDEGLATSVIQDFEARLEDGQPEIIRAFASLAADSGPRGAKALSFLEERVTHPASSAHLEAAAQALSLSNTPGAAAVLSRFFGQSVLCDRLLEAMGDAAVPALLALAEAGAPTSPAALRRVGTPAAIHALMRLLCSADRDIALRAALVIATPRLSLDMARAFDELGEDGALQRSEEYFWVWQPFMETPDAEIRLLAARVAEVLDRAIKSPSAPPAFIDPRVVVPLVVQRAVPADRDAITGAISRALASRPLEHTRLERQLRKEWGSEGTQDDVARMFKSLLGILDSGASLRASSGKSELVGAVLEEVVDALPHRIGSLLVVLEPGARARTVLALMERKPPTPAAWRRMRGHSYSPWSGFAWICIPLGVYLLTLYALAQAASVALGFRGSQDARLWAATGVASMVFGLILLARPHLMGGRINHQKALSLVVLAPFLSWQTVRDLFRPVSGATLSSDSGSTPASVRRLMLLPATSFTPAVLYFGLSSPAVRGNMRGLMAAELVWLGFMILPPCVSLLLEARAESGSLAWLFSEANVMPVHNTLSPPVQAAGWAKDVPESSELPTPAPRTHSDEERS